MKKLLSLILAALMIFSLVSCNETTNNEKSDSDYTDDSDNNNGITDDDNNENINDDIENNVNCITHNYIDNICSVCGCSLWNGETNTSWYNVIDSEFTISTADQFAGLIDIVNNGSDLENVKITLANHIDMNNHPISPIGSSSNTSFSGYFDGNNYTIENVLINTDSISTQENGLYLGEMYYSSCVGVFGYCEGTIKNTNIENLNIDINSQNINRIDIGGLVAYGISDIDNCSVSGKIKVTTSKQFTVGGLAAFAYGNVCDCKTDVQIETSLICNDDVNPLISGLVAYCKDITVERCVSRGNISFEMVDDEIESSELCLGGLVGKSDNGIVKNCYTTLNISSNAIRNDWCYIGGLAGWIDTTSIENCYSTGNIVSNCSGISYVGGLVGYVFLNCSISGCFVIGNISSETGRTGCVGTIAAFDVYNVISNSYYSSSQSIVGKEVVKNGNPANPNDLTNIAFYTNRMSWDSEVWNLTDGEYPTLK